MPRAGDIRIGISGWTYPRWRGKFYPRELPRRSELGYAAKMFRSVEINGTFYCLQRPESFAAWAAATPEDFVFSVKGSRFITHMLRLGDVSIALANFFASGVLRLEQKLGPILWQLPPQTRFRAEHIERFLRLLPKDTESAAMLAGRHDKRVSGRAWMKVSGHRPLRHCMEVRNVSFAVPEFIELLRAYGVALVCADTADWPLLMDITSDFLYCRLHGSEELYASGYDERALRKWAARVVAWARGKEPPGPKRVVGTTVPRAVSRDVFVYFDNDAKVRAPFDAQGLIQLVEDLQKLRPNESQSTAVSRSA